MTQKHTPLPWWIEKDERIESTWTRQFPAGTIRIFGHKAGFALGSSVAAVSEGSENDADLIVRAVNCHEEMKDLLGLCDTALYHASQGMEISGIPELLARIRAAIAKATEPQ